jgi:molybdenum cofactor cytidylyltransferase
MDNIYGIILAAGASTRMKTQKMLLSFGNETVIETVLRKVRGVLQQNVVVVIGANNEEIIEKVEFFPTHVTVNKNYLQGMLSSVIAGFNVLPVNAEAILVFLGDQPQIPQKVIYEVINSWKKTGKGIIIPIFKGHRGHPVLIESKFKTDILKLNPDKGLRELMEKHKRDIFEMECPYPEILRDMDTPEEYANELKSLLSGKPVVY